MESVFSYIIGLGAAVMMPIIFTILGACIGIKFGKALKSGLLVGVGFVGLNIITKLLTDTLTTPLEQIMSIYQINLSVLDTGWPAAAAVAYSTSVGAFIIPVCLGINLVLLLCKCTKTVNIDLWNYWHFAFIGAVVYYMCFSEGLGDGISLAWGFFAAIVCYIITLVLADLTAKKFQSFYSDVDGISIPQPFVQGFMPFAIVINKLLDYIPGINKVNVDAEWLKNKFGVIGEPLFIGIIVGCGIGVMAYSSSWDLVVDNIPSILKIGISTGAVMELIPRITSLFIEGLKPISEATKALIAKKFGADADLYICMSPALVIGHPTTLVASIILIPITLLLAVVLEPCGNSFFPVASLAGMLYVFPMILPFTKGNVIKSVIIGFIILTIGLFFVTWMADAFTLAVHTGNSGVELKEGFKAGSLDFGSSPIAALIYFPLAWSKYIAAGILVVITCALVVWNRIRIIKNK